MNDRLLAEAGSVLQVPLCVDLDGTLLKTDLLWESLVALLKAHPLYLFVLPLWAVRGRACLKYELAARVALNVASLPYHEAFLAFLKQEHARGRQLLLVTASPVQLARGVADHLGIFSEVIASDRTRNLSGLTKRRVLQERFGTHGFGYAGNAPVDLAIWSCADHAVVVNATGSLTKRVSQCVRIARCFPRERGSISAVLHALRVHQWSKNLLLFVPLITSHSWGNLALIGQAFMAALAFSVCASGAYLINDVLDLDGDRQDAMKRCRPLASGDLSLLAGGTLTLFLFVSSIALATFFSTEFVATLLCYFLVTCLYSVYLKSLAMVDVITLAGLYTLRLYAGCLAIGVEPSKWLLAFSVFLFVSLALVKRYAELARLATLGRQTASRRGYLATDVPSLAAMGTASGYLAVLVFALYLNSPDVTLLYTAPGLLWLICPILLYWISRVWLLATRGALNQDPIAFALRDANSYLAGLLTILIVLLAV